MIKECFQSQLGDFKAASAEGGGEADDKERKVDLYFAFYQTL